MEKGQTCFPRGVETRAELPCGTTGNRTIGKHIANALKEELKEMATVAKFATVQNEGGRNVTRQVEYYDLDVILSVGYRVKSPQGIRFRRWANGVLKSQLMRRASDNKLLKELERRFSNHEFRLADVEQAMKYVLNTLLPPVQNRRRIGFGVGGDDDMSAKPYGKK